MATVTLQGSQEVEDWIASLPEDAHPLEILYQLMKMRLTANVLHRLHKLESLSKRYPSLEPYILSVLRRVQMEAQQLLHELSRGRYPDGYSHLLAGAVFGAVLPLLDGSLNVLLPGQSATEASGAITFDEYLDATFGYLRNGF